ncbi:bifunctional epoxide hydrolase 2 isoform X2 [Artibeus jamaicensis]|uniref:bifunctional epoxide hydrolase 2 isoform X2 n=1 Tax=Artibeus jamaicensis TaxID=9417 RepID=UPI00235ADEAC|nr:bifunctional epoxide hydrolase 2 isoform X2 [Artibeus jamaicensis]
MAAMALRAVVFDLDGVLALPSVARAPSRTEEELALPRGFLNGVFKKGELDGSTNRVMRGEITFSQWISLIEEHCRKHSEDSGITLPENFSVSQVLRKAISERKINRPMLQAALALRKKGLTTCILTNNWLDDSTQRSCWAQLICELKPHFDLLIESCWIGMAKPDLQIYKFVLDTLKASPNEVVFLDDIGSNLKPARDLGMVTILVHDSNVALQELERVTGMQLLETEAPLPAPCRPSDVSHGYVPIKPGVHLHFVELGSGPAVCLCHGFPESWFSWKYQIPALAQAGFRVLAVDLKGYGESSAPPEIEEYSLEVLCKDMVTFLDKLGVAEAELEENLDRTFKSILRSHDEFFPIFYNIRKTGGLLVKAPKEPSLSKLMSEEDIQYYVQQFKKSGFRGPLNWYRNIDRNWKWFCKGTGRKILIPALMVTAEKDFVLTPAMSEHMEDWIPRLKRGHIKDCGHFTQIEKPTEVNRILIQWLETDARDPPGTSKL